MPRPSIRHPTDTNTMPPIPHIVKAQNFILIFGMGGKHAMEEIEKPVTVDKLANKFEVSNSAMSIRLGVPYEYK